MNLTQKYVQTSAITMEKTLAKFQALKIFLQNERGKIVERAINYATETCNDMDISIERRGRTKKKKTMPAEMTPDAGVTLTEEIQRAMFEGLDRFFSGT